MGRDRPTRGIEAKQARSRANREALLDALESLLNEQPYDEIGIADIARRAGLTTGALYGRFGDKQGLALALHERFVMRSAETMEAWGARPEWATATPREIINNWTRGAINFGRMYRPLVSLMMKDPAIRDQYDELLARPSMILTRLLCSALPDTPGPGFEDDVAWAARAALVVLERFDLDDDTLYGRIETMLCRLIGVD